MTPVDVAWARMAYRQCRYDALAPTPKVFARYDVGNPRLDETGAPPPIWCVHVALMRAHAIADAFGVARVEPETLKPRKGEHERQWVDRAGSMLAAWAMRTSTSRASRKDIGESVVAPDAPPTLTTPESES